MSFELEKRVSSKKSECRRSQKSKFRGRIKRARTDLFLFTKRYRERESEREI